MREGVTHLRIEGKGEKIRFIPLAIEAQRLIAAYLDKAGHKDNLDAPLFRPVKTNVTGTLHKPLDPASVYQAVVKHYRTVRSF